MRAGSSRNGPPCGKPATTPWSPRPPPSSKVERGRRAGRARRARPGRARGRRRRRARRSRRPTPPTRTLGRVDTGDDVRVGEHVLRGDDEAAAVEPSAAGARRCPRSPRRWRWPCGSRAGGRPPASAGRPRGCVSGDSPPNTVGRPLSSSTRRNDENSVSADSGMTPSTAVMIRESPICRESEGTGPGRNDDARNHDDQQHRDDADQRAQPGVDHPGRLPGDAVAHHRAEPARAPPGRPSRRAARCAMASSDWNSAGVEPLTPRVGATSSPMTPPPRKPTKASTPTTKPWR